MSAEEIVRGLLGYCKYEVTGHGERWARVDIFDLQQAADLIESQAAEMAKLLERIAEMEGQLTEEISRRYQAECNYDHWKATCENERAQLAASQRRERAAVEDLAIACKVGEPCAVCKQCRDMGDQFPCAKCDDWCKGEHWKWRGPSGGKD